MHIPGVLFVSVQRSPVPEVKQQSAACLCIRKPPQNVLNAAIAVIRRDLSFLQHHNAHWAAAK